MGVFSVASFYASQLLSWGAQAAHNIIEDLICACDILLGRYLAEFDVFLRFAGSFGMNPRRRILRCLWRGFGRRDGRKVSRSVAKGEYRSGTADEALNPLGAEDPVHARQAACYEANPCFQSDKVDCSRRKNFKSVSVRGIRSWRNKAHGLRRAAWHQI